MQVIINVPDRYLVDENPDEIAQKIKLYTAILMFQTGQLSAGAACEFAGTDRYSFIAACKRHCVPVVDYPKDQLESDFQNLKKARHPC